MTSEAAAGAAGDLDAEPFGRRVLAGMRAAVPLILPTLAIGASFGVVAAPVIGSAAAIVMSLVVFGGTAQLAALSALAGGGGAGAAIAAGLLMNGRFLSMGFAVAPWMRSRALVRAAQGQALVDPSWALASRGDGRFDVGMLVGSSIPQWVCWTGGTVIGVLAGDAIGDPADLGLDTIFPAFYLALLAKELRDGRALVVAVLGGALALSLLPVAPPGVPIIAASGAALLGLRRAA